MEILQQNSQKQVIINLDQLKQNDKGSYSLWIQ
jgi:hypothetical protein